MFEKNCMEVAFHMNVMINQGSFQMMRVVHVTSDISDKTLTIPSNTLGSLNADFNTLSEPA